MLSNPTRKTESSPRLGKSSVLERLMSAMKTTHSHMHDGLADFLPIISRHLGFRIELTEVRCVEFCGHFLEGLS